MAFIKPLSVSRLSVPAVGLAKYLRYNYNNDKNILFETSRSLCLHASLHPLYDIAAVSTYVAYFLAQYWTGEQRRDIEFFAIFMGIIWNFTHDHDVSIFIMLWLIGGVSEFVSKSFLAGGNEIEYENFRVGIKLGGYMSFLFLVFDVLDVLTGY